MPTCLICHIFKSKDQFRLFKTGNANRYGCHECRKDMQTHAPKGLYSTSRPTDFIAPEYGLTVPLIKDIGRRLIFYKLPLKEFHLMVVAHKGRCGICKVYLGAGGLDIDHDHNTGIVRGLLCASCNTNLGYIESGSAINRVKDSSPYLTYLETCKRYDPRQEAVK